MNVAGVLWLASDGEDPYPVEMPAAASAPEPLELPDPSRSGDHAIETLTYGSGKDIRRPEFGDDVSWVSPTVDATRMLPGVEGLQGEGAPVVLGALARGRAAQRPRLRPDR